MLPPVPPAPPVLVLPPPPPFPPVPAVPPLEEDVEAEDVEVVSPSSPQPFSALAPPTNNNKGKVILGVSQKAKIGRMPQGYHRPIALPRLNLLGGHAFRIALSV